MDNAQNTASNQAAEFDSTSATKGTFERPTPAKKISAKSIIGAVKQSIKAAGGKADQTNDEGVVTEPANYVELFRATGQITGVKTGNSTFGEWVAYTGTIMGINMVTGEVFKGTELFLPAEADIVLRDPLVAATKAGQVVEIAIAIEAKFAKTAVGYMYRCRPLLALDQPKNRAAELLMQFGGPKLALAAPKAETAAPVDTAETVPADSPAPEAAAELVAKGNKRK